MLVNAAAQQPVKLSLKLQISKTPSRLCTRSRVAAVVQCAKHALRWTQIRQASSKSSTRWQARQANDAYTREARVAGLKSRAAFKLLQINERYHIFRSGQTVVDLGYAPGSWSQVAVNRCSPGGRVIGVDILPTQPPRGVSTIQGNFLSPEIQAEVRALVLDKKHGQMQQSNDNVEDRPSLIELEKHNVGPGNEAMARSPGANMRVVNVVLSDMSEPWDLTSGFGKASLTEPYRRMMNTSGISFRDHAGSMDLCTAALEFAYDTLKPGGHFVCKFFQGAEDKLLQKRIMRLFEKTHREKPSASRSESREGYFVALRRKEKPSKAEVLAE